MTADEQEDAGGGSDSAGKDLDAIVTQERRAKMERLREEGVEPYPHILFPGRTWIADVLAAHDPGELEAGEHSQWRYSLAGRLISRRGHGKTAFLDLRDRSGLIQLHVQLDTAGEDLYQRMLELDIGDLVGVEGCVYVTQRGQLALNVHACTLLAKALRPPPAKYHGLEDVETRYRHRELDLMANERTREMFLTRAETMAAIRTRMSERGFIEVDTPVLQMLAGGANARPFVTHHNALNRDLSLRISVELYLKRCIIGGLENVYDLGKCFRNEGISHRHSPEFTVLEWTMSYSDYMDVASFTEEMVAGVAMSVLGTTEVQHGEQVIDLSTPWRRVSLQEAIVDVTGVDFMEAEETRLVELLGERVDPEAGWGELVEDVYTKLVEPSLIQPTIVYDFPIESHVLVKRHREHPRLGEHFDAAIGGIEVADGGTELNDPDEQRARFVEQRQRRAGDEQDKPHPHDEEYVRALEQGLPPSAGGGMGVDRLMMILTGQESLREVVPFPLLRDPR
jgi:lysyl-tRNA synthetase, class II